MHSRFQTLAVAVAAAGLLTVGTATATATAEPTAADAMPDPGTAAEVTTGKTTSGATATGDVQAATVSKHVWRTASSYYSTSSNFPTGGRLYAGNNYFYCQKLGQMETYGRYANSWWLKTDDDSGNSKVWVSAVYISEGMNHSPIPGVKRC